MEEVEESFMLLTGRLDEEEEEVDEASVGVKVLCDDMLLGESSWSLSDTDEDEWWGNAELTATRATRSTI